MVDPSGQGGHRNARGMGLLDEPVRRRPQRRGNQCDIVGEGDVDQWAHTLRVDADAGHAALLALTPRGRWQWRHLAASGHLLDPFAMAAGHHRLETPELDSTALGTDVLAWDQQIDPERPALRLLGDPLQIHVELLG